MTPDDEWDLIQNRRRSPLWFGISRALRVALLFGSVAVALALVLAPVADNLTRSPVAAWDGLDHGATGSVGKRSGYTIRRSVMQAPGAVCIIRADGLRSGSC